MSKSEMHCICAIIIAGSLAGGDAAAQSEPKQEETLRVTVPPAVQSGIVIHTQPGASCVIRPAKGGDVESEARMFADSKGVAQFFVRPEKSTSEINSLRADPRS